MQKSYRFIKYFSMALSWLFGVERNGRKQHGWQVLLHLNLLFKLKYHNFRCMEAKIVQARRGGVGGRHYRSMAVMR